MTDASNASRLIRDDAAAHNAVRDLAPAGSFDIVDLGGVIINDTVRIVAMSPQVHEDLENAIGTAGLDDLVADFAYSAGEDPGNPGRLVTKVVPTICRTDEVWIEYLGPNWAWICYPTESQSP
jgi:hypothetical protein